MATSRKPLFEADEATAPLGQAIAPPADEAVSAPPEADTVAGRALMIAALSQRATLESEKDFVKFKKLQQWVERYGLFGHLGEAGAELFDAELGSWSDEDVDTVGWVTDELQVLLWALQRADFPTLDTRPDVAKLVSSVPLLGEADSFLDGATLRPLDEIEAHLALSEALLEAIRSEVYARSILEDPAALEVDAELEELLTAMAERGFNRKDAAKGGPHTEAVQGLRFWGRTLLTELFAEGTPHAAHRIDSAKLVSLDDATLATWLGGAQGRTEALAWLVEGDEEAEGPLDD